MKNLFQKGRTAPAEAVQTEIAAEETEPLPYLPAADALKFWLMPFVCVLCFGFPTRYGGNVSALCGFAPLCFFILSGFFALNGKETERDRLLLGVIRSGVMFAIMFGVCLAANILYYLLTGAKLAALFSALTSKRVLFNIFVLCAWPFSMGESIWFVQSLLYAYLILYCLNRLGLRRLHLPLMIVCAVLMLLTGELAGVFGFRFLGAPYLPPNGLTRALPYMLLGGLMREKMAVWSEKKAWVYLIMIPLGLALAYGEFTLLSLTGRFITTSHAVGLGLTAFGLCAWVLYYIRIDPYYSGFACVAGRPIARRIYLMSQLVAFLLIVPMSEFFPRGAVFVQELGGLIVYPVCLGLASLYEVMHDPTAE